MAGDIGVGAFLVSFGICILHPEPGLQVPFFNLAACIYISRIDIFVINKVVIP